MGIIFMASADSQDTRVFSSSTDLQFNSTYKRTGTYGYYGPQNGTGFIQNFSNLTEGYFRGAFNVSGEASIVFRDSAGATHILLKIVENSFLLFNLGDYTTILSRSIKVNTLMTLIEVHWLINNTTGVLQVKVNGELVIDYTGDTQNTTNVGVSSIWCRASFAGSYFYFDDILIRDDRWPGRGGVQILKPNAGSTTENWTASTGDPETCIDDLPPSYTDYIYTNALVDNTEHLVGIESLPATSYAINGVGLVVKGKLTTTSTANLATLLKSGATLATGSSVAVDTNDTCIQTFYDLNPADSAAFEDADINALEVGVETVV